MPLFSEKRKVLSTCSEGIFFIYFKIQPWYCSHILELKLWLSDKSKWKKDKNHKFSINSLTRVLLQVVLGHLPWCPSIVFRKWVGIGGTFPHQGFWLAVQMERYLVEQRSCVKYWVTIRVVCYLDTWYFVVASPCGSHFVILSPRFVRIPKLSTKQKDCRSIPNLLCST